MLTRAGALAALLLFLGPIHFQAQQANTNAFYRQLRGLLPGGEVIQVNNLEINRDAAKFTFRNGSFAFYGDVNGKVTGAVFGGSGHLHISPPTAQERHNLSVTTHAEEFDEDFDQVVLRFTDGTSAELHKASSTKGVDSSPLIKAAQEFQNFARMKLHSNFDLRILADVASPTAGGYFLAAIHGKRFPHLVLILDPLGAEAVAPEEVELLSWNDWGPSIPLAFHFADDYKNGTVSGKEANDPYRILNETLDTTIEKNGYLAGEATIELRAERDGVAVIPLDLYPTLRVSQVEDAKGQPLEFVQEKKENDPDFGVVLNKPLGKGESTTVRVIYAGKDVVMNEGGANYYPIARESWYPNTSSGLGNYAMYRMKFHVPKGLQLIATGTKVNENNEGKTTNTEWKTDVPLAMVGFNLGKFEMKEDVVPGKLGDDLTIDAYANSSKPDNLTQPTLVPGGGLPVMDNPIMESISTPRMLPVELSQGRVAAQIYTTYFGALPFTRVAITQQFACNYGQSWPMLVYLPICGFFDSTQQHFMGLRPEDMYWKVVTPHEVAHQWWGQTVGFKSYRDQWMSEGFANTSASIFLQATRPKPDEFREFWKQQRKLITEKNVQGFRPIDVGPVTMGFRLSTDKTGWDIYQNLVYPKGAYILHMIRMMMWTPQEGDQRFMATMHDFVATYRLQAATTEDFKAIVEKHMSPAMDLDGNHRMDWFFNEYVYGTDLPNYHFESQITPQGDGNSFHFKLTQSGVGANFKMVVPLYLEMTDGKVLRLGLVPLAGASTAEQTGKLPKLPAPVKRALIDYNCDVLSTEN